jgi:uncharacterized protein YggE
MHTNRLLVLFALLTAACTGNAAPAAPPCCDHDKPDAPKRTLAVTGTATLDVVPDVADVVFTVSGEAARPKAATAAARARQAKLTTALRAAGIAEAELALSHLSIGPTYDSVTGRQKGYVASITVTASTKDFDLVGDLMDAGADAGATGMSTRFRVGDLATLKKQVRAMALDAVKDKAKQTTDALGVALGDVQSIAEDGGSTWGSWAVENVYSAQMIPQAGAHADLQPLTLSVTVTYELG